ncbi:hypothetical protein [Cellulomonas sp.]|uniref:hypothetical protein n=1 Tax=Cellulomonas sp. TaxID=40001 RepID=UPI003BAD53DF
MSAQTSTRVTITNNCGNLAAVVNVRYKGNPYEYWTIVLNPLKSTTLTAAHPIKLGAWGLAAQP